MCGFGPNFGGLFTRTLCARAHHLATPRPARVCFSLSYIFHTLISVYRVIQLIIMFSSSSTSKMRLKSCYSAHMNMNGHLRFIRNYWNFLWLPNNSNTYLQVLFVTPVVAYQSNSPSGFSETKTNLPRFV
jgi:hypothetical protein